MKRHVIGFIIFSIIVVSAALVYSLFRPFEIPKVPTALTVGEERPYACDRLNKDIGYRIVSAEYDMSSGRFISEIELKWKGNGRPPEKAYVSLFLTERGTAPEQWVFSGDVIEKPFANGNRARSIISIHPNALRKFQDWNNIYAFVDLSKYGNFRTSIDERKWRSEFVPVLKIH